MDKTITFETAPIVGDIEKAVKDLYGLMGRDKEYPWQKVKVTFREPTRVVVNRYSSKLLKNMLVDFFTSATGHFCYTFHKRTGFALGMDMASRIKALSIAPLVSHDLKKIRRVKSLARKIHVNAWDDLRKKMEETPEKYFYHGLALIDISRKFPKSVIEALENAFENKKEYSYGTSGTKRDLSVSTSLCEDGIFRAWFSSEYAGCGNGSYYLLLNPRYASIREDD